jgi:hypothetical protein
MLNYIFFSYILICISILLSNYSYAQGTLEGDAKEASIVGLALEKIDGSIGLSYVSNFKNQNESDAEASTALETLVSYNYEGANQLRLFAGINQQQYQGRETLLDDGFIAWANDELWLDSEYTKIGQQIRLAIPLSKNSVNRDSKISGITLAPRILQKLTPIGLSGVTMTYIPSLTKNFHRYTVNRTFRTNNEYELTQLINLTLSLTDRYFISSDFLYRNVWSYQGSKKDDNYSYRLAAGSALTKELIVSAGVTTASLIQNFENGRDKNITLFDNQKSNYYVDLMYLF